ncbi:MAG: type II toxin-antitoxin system VapC family toxin [Litorimonas sp.]
MIVVDASLVIHVCIKTSARQDLVDTLIMPDSALIAPEIIDLEFLQVMRRYARNGTIGSPRISDAFETLNDLSIIRYGHRLLRDRIWSLRDNLTAYDAAYFALAEHMDAPLWTRDRKFAGIPGHSAEVVIV